MREQLCEARARRAWPLKDDKILTGWNGLMITAFARAAQTLDDPGYAADGEHAADFLLSRLRRGGRLLHTFRAGEAKIPAYLDDYAFLCRGLLDLHAATGRDRWREEARILAAQMIDLFWDDAGSGFFFTASDQQIPITRGKDPFDSAIPSGNAVAAEALLRLAELDADPALAERAGRTLATFRELIGRAASAAPQMLLSLDLYLDWRAKQPTAPERGLPHVVHASATLADGAIHRGDALRLLVRLQIDPGWHINPPQPMEPSLTPTAVEIVPERGLQIHQVHYPDPQWLQPQYAERALTAYEGEAEILADLEANPDVEPGEARITVRVRYQPCDSERCLAPVEEEITVPVCFAAE
jgi:hypothetical protein